MASIAILPTPLARAAAAARNPQNAGTCGIHDIAARLGQAHRRPAWLCATIDALIAHQAFPAPFPLQQAGRIVRNVRADSRWPRVVVDLWFDDQLPPEARAVIRSADRHALDTRLGANLATLFDGHAA